MLPTTTQYATVASGDTLSGTFPLRGASAISIIAPALTSCALYLQIATDTTSANFQRVWDTNGGAVWSWDLAAGNAAIAVKDHFYPANQGRIEVSAAQTDNRSFTIISK